MAGLLRTSLALVAGSLLIGLTSVRCEVADKSDHPVPAAIVTGQVDQAIARANREWLESKSGVVALPAGEIVFDRAPQLQSGVTLQGAGRGRTILQQRFTSSPFIANCTLSGFGAGIGHVHPLTHGKADRANLKADMAAGWITVEPSIAEKCPPGTLVYTFKYDGYRTPNDRNPIGQRNERRKVMERVNHSLRLDAPIDREADRLKWFSDASPMSDAAEGTALVTVASDAAAFSANTWVLVTSGASIANEATGEIRRVVAVDGHRIRLDRPVRRSYRNAALARIQVCADVTLRDLTIDLPINAASESLYASLAVGWRIERCAIRKTAFGNCCDWRVTDSDLGYVQAAAASHDLQFRDCRIESITFEEGCCDNLIADSRVGPVAANTNCISLRAQADRLTVRNSMLFGGDSPSSQIYFDGPCRDCALESVTMTGRTPCWIAGDRLRITGVTSDGDIHVQGGQQISIAQVRSNRLVLGTPGRQSSGVVIDAGRPEIRQGDWKRP